MADDGKKSGGLGSSLAQAEGLLQIAIVLPLCCLIGWFVGDLLDKHFHTTWMMMVGIALGAAAGLISVIRTASSYLKRSGS